MIDDVLKVGGVWEFVVIDVNEVGNCKFLNLFWWLSCGVDYVIWKNWVIDFFIGNFCFGNVSIKDLFYFDSFFDVFVLELCWVLWIDCEGGILGKIVFEVDVDLNDLSLWVNVSYVIVGDIKFFGFVFL